MFTPRFRHLIFDLDGTLADTKEDLAAAMNRALASLDLSPLRLEQVSGYVGNGARVLVERALGPGHLQLTDRALALFLAYYNDQLLDRTRVYAGIESVLACASDSGIAMNVLTNKPEAPSRAILVGLRLDGYFAAVVGGDTLPTRKPDPQGVFHLQRLTGVPLAETLLIGDSRVDCETGRNAGIATCGVTWGFAAESLKAVPPTFVADTPEQLRRLICGD